MLGDCLGEELLPLLPQPLQVDLPHIDDYEPDVAGRVREGHLVRRADHYELPGEGLGLLSVRKPDSVMGLGDSRLELVPVCPLHACKLFLLDEPLASDFVHQVFLIMEGVEFRPLHVIVPPDDFERGGLPRVLRPLEYGHVLEEDTRLQYPRHHPPEYQLQPLPIQRHVRTVEYVAQLA